VYLLKLRPIVAAFNFDEEDEQDGSFRSLGRGIFLGTLNTVQCCHLAVGAAIVETVNAGTEAVVALRNYLSCLNYHRAMLVINVRLQRLLGRKGHILLNSAHTD